MLILFNVQEAKLMSQLTEQIKIWASEFGKEYTDRNNKKLEEVDELYKKNYGISRTELNELFLGNMDRSIKILEVGCNVGIQLLFLQRMGFKNLYGIELQSYAVELAKSRTKNINIIQGTAFDIPFRDNFFDLVFTSGVLIHIHPSDIVSAIKEIYRCTNEYIWGFEYYSNEYVEVKYRGKENLLWKANFSRLYLNTFNDLELVKEMKLKYLDNENVDVMFLLKKVKK